MSSTLTNLQTAVLGIVGRPSTDPLLASSNLTQALNNAAHLFATEYPWPWLETSENIATTNGNDTYTVGSAATYIDTISLHVAGQPPLTRMSRAELLRQFPGTVSGHPLFYARVGISSLMVRPTPLTGVLPTLVHLYHKAETALSGGSDTLLCPVWYEQAVLWRAAYELAMRAGDRARAADFLEMYKMERERALEQVRRTKDLSDGNDIQPPQPLAVLPGEKAAV